MSTPAASRIGRLPAGIQLFLLLCVAAAARGLWLLAIPPQALSADIQAWNVIGATLSVGLDPFKFHFLNWPPFWMEVIYFVMKFSVRWGWDFYLCVRLVLLIADLSVLAATFQLLRLLNPKARRGRLLLFGYCLNPLLILLTVEHANFDAFATLWVVLAVGFLIRFRRGGETIDWLWACGCLGMGIFTKTFPLALTPLLVVGARKLDWRACCIGALLVIGPTSLALAPLYVLQPAVITSDILEYRSFGANFGVNSLVYLVAGARALALYVQWFTPVFLAALAALAAGLWRRNWRRDGDIVLLAAIVLLSCFTLGSGYGQQYWFWVMPLLLICYREYSGVLRIAILVWGVITVITNILEYAIMPALGRFWYCWYPSPQLKHVGEMWVVDDRLRAVVQLPMTLATLAVMAAGIAILAGRGQHK